MRFKTIGFALLAAAFMAAAFAGCEASVGTPSDQDQLERIINEQLPGKIADQVENPQVEGTTCVAADKPDTYECVSTVNFTVEGEKKSEEVLIDGSCNDETCRWETRD